MNDSNTVTDQDIGGSTYVSIDGILKYCITAPLDLPIDFKEWYKPTRINTTQLYQI